MTLRVSVSYIFTISLRCYASCWYMAVWCLKPVLIKGVCVTVVALQIGLVNEPIINNTCHLLYYYKKLVFTKMYDWNTSANVFHKKLISRKTTHHQSCNLIHSIWTRL